MKMNTDELKKLECFKSFRTLHEDNECLVLFCDRADTEHFKDYENIAIYFTDDAMIHDTIVFIQKNKE